MVFTSQRSRLRAEAGPVKPTVDPADIRGLSTTLLVSVGCLPLSRGEGRSDPPRNAFEDCTKPGPRLCAESGVHFVRLHFDGHLPGDGPHEGDQFPGDCRDSDIRVFAAADEAAETLTEPNLRFPPDVLDDLGKPFIPFLDVRRDLGRVAVGPGALDECAPCTGVPGLGDRPLGSFRTGGVLRGDQPDESGELTWVVEAREVSEFSDHGDRDGVLDAAQCLQRFDDGMQAPRGSKLGDLGFETFKPIDLLIDGTDELLEGDLLGRSRTDDPGQVAAVSIGPVRTTGVVEPQAQEERLQAQLGCLEGDACCVAGTAEVSDRFVFDRGDIDRGEIPRTQQTSEFESVSPIVFDLVPGTFGDE